jgi:predicted transcriptional regulator
MPITAGKSAALIPSKPGNRVYTDEMALFLKYMSPERLELLEYLRLYGPRAIRKAAMDLYRHHQSVRKDIRELQQVRLVDETKDGMFFVPWDEIIVHSPLDEKRDKRNI